MKKKYDIRGIFAQMEIDLIASMKRNLTRHENEEKKEGFEWDQWQEKKLLDLKQYKQEATQIVKKTEPVVNIAIEREVKGGFLDGIKRAAKKLLGKIIPDKLDVEGVSDENFFKLNEKRVNALTSAAQGEMKAARFAVLRQADDIFRQTIFKSQVYLNSGAASLNQAIDMATGDFLDKGFDCIQFANGRRMNIASYAEMALRASSQRAVFEGEGAKRKQQRNPFVVVSAHSNCSELCLPWQGKVYIDDVYSGGKASDGPYPLLSKAMAAGLFHPNCRHNMTTFIPGKSRLPEPVNDAEALANYKAEQKQRYMERQIRKYKRRESGSVDPINQAAAAAKVKEWQGKLREHVKANEHLRRDYSREKFKIPVQKIPDNGLHNKNKPLEMQPEAIKHASKGEFTNPKNPKKQAIGNFSKGGHGEENIQLLIGHGIEYNVVKEYKNGVRIGNVPSHKDKLKKSGTKQSWFPKSWTAEDIEKAGMYVANLQDPDQFQLEPKKVNGELISIFKYANYRSVTVGVVYDTQRKGITTIFPDETQRLVGDEEK
jgi:hypothetical protein